MTQEEDNHVRTGTEAGAARHKPRTARASRSRTGREGPFLGPWDEFSPVDGLSPNFRPREPRGDAPVVSAPFAVLGSQALSSTGFLQPPGCWQSVVLPASGRIPPASRPSLAPCPSQVAAWGLTLKRSSAWVQGSQGNALQALRLGVQETQLLPAQLVT